jgi:hypothetical protein
MAANPNQQGGGGGGMFARYGGEQVASLPPGYLEAAQAQASMYANVGQQIANAIVKQQEIKLKKEEIKVASETNTVNAGKNAAAERKNDLAAEAKEDDAMVKWVTARTNASKETFGALDNAIQTTDARIAGLELQLARNNDPEDKNPKLTLAEKNSLLGQIEALKTKRAGHQAQADEVMLGMKNLPSSLAEYKIQEAERIRKEIDKRIKDSGGNPETPNPIRGFMDKYVKPAARVAGPFMQGLPGTISAPVSLFNAYQSNNK